MQQAVLCAGKSILLTLYSLLACGEHNFAHRTMYHNTMCHNTDICLLGPMTDGLDLLLNGIRDLCWCHHDCHAGHGKVPFFGCRGPNAINNRSRGLTRSGLHIRLASGNRTNCCAVADCALAAPWGPGPLRFFVYKFGFKWGFESQARPPPWVCPEPRI